MIKKIITIFSISLLTIILVSCKPKNLKVGIIIYEEHDTFMTEFITELTNIKESNIDFEIVYSLSSQSKQNQQVIELLNKKVDLLVINPVDRLASKTIIEKTKASNTPIIFINRQPQKSDLDERDNLYYVGANPKNQGKLQGDVAAMFLGDPNNLNIKYDHNRDNIVQTVILKGEPGHQDTEDRTNESIKQLTKLGYKIEVLQTKVANWQRSEAKQAMLQLETKFPGEIELILSNNDDMALGAIDYYLEKDDETTPNTKEVDNKIIVGVDKTKPAIDAILQGLMNGTVLNDFKNQANAVNELISILIAGKNIEDLSYPLTNNKYILLEGEIFVNR